MQCASSIVALDLLAAKLRTAAVGFHALMVAATKQSMIVDYSDKASSFMYDFSDGAAAVLLGNSGGKYEVLESSVLTDGRFSDVVYQGLGGERFMDSSGDYMLRVNRTEEFSKVFEEVSLRNFAWVVRDALAKSGLSVDDVDYLALLHMKRSFHYGILKELGIPPDKSIYLDYYGHMQSIDPFLSLRLAEERGIIRRGQRGCAGLRWDGLDMGGRYSNKASPRRNLIPSTLLFVLMKYAPKTKRGGADSLNKLLDAAIAVIAEKGFNSASIGGNNGEGWGVPWPFLLLLQEQGRTPC